MRGPFANQSFSAERFPSAMKVGVVTEILKKSCLDFAFDQSLTSVEFQKSPRGLYGRF